tara:strand:- start:413 stop:898 length:486 start_codon:yes stop_codon:yes gene_type:complete
MSLHKIKQQGFTIVELLIVVVVIGILAAIVIVAYNGVTQSARNTGYKSDAASIAKLAETYNAQVGSYPQTAANFSSSSYPGKMPSSIDVIVTSGTVTNTTSSGTSDPTTSNHTWAMYENTSSGKKFYSMRACGASTGATIYYPVLGAASSAVGKANAGSGC